MKERAGAMPGWLLSVALQEASSQQPTVADLHDL
jgi:hypothetical protein